VYTKAYAASGPSPDAEANNGIALGAGALAVGAIAVGLLALSFSGEPCVWICVGRWRAIRPPPPEFATAHATVAPPAPPRAARAPPPTRAARPPPRPIGSDVSSVSGDLKALSEYASAFAAEL
jgi:hypothetical protein